MAHRTKYNGATFYCYRCLHGFTREDLLQEHTTYCLNASPQAIKMPPPSDSILRFTGTRFQLPLPFCIYADFESLLVPVQTVSPTTSSSFSHRTAKHIPCGYAYVIVNSEGKSLKPVAVYRGENAVEHFLDAMLQEKEDLGKKLNEIKPMQLTDDEERQFQRAATCSICDKPLGTDRARDHDHLTGAFRGASHIACNINFKLSKTIPVVFHNLRNYDAHHIMTTLGKYKDHQIDVIPNTLEKYISFKIRRYTSSIQMVFLDSYQFLPASLEKLANNLQPSQFTILQENFPATTDFTLLKRKGVYPYEYFTSFEKFEEKELPPPSAFFSTLSGEGITDEDYQHVQRVWQAFQMKTLGDLHDLYVKTDVLLLADIFENFRRLSLQYYKIDAAHLYTSPGLSWQACLKMCDVELELFTDINMLLFVEKGIRGGVSQISHRFAKANNPDVPGYDKEKPHSYIMYWDANNLYGWSMSQYLPYGKFRWVDETSFNEDVILSLEDEAPRGYLFEVDLDYPAHLHVDHNDYPLAPERLEVTQDMLSSHAKTLLSNKFKGTPKLIPNLQDKQHYVVHYRNLKLYLQLGLKLKKVHKVLEFHQAPWLREYIHFNTEKRKNAATSFERDFFKLLNNSIYGKTIENLRKRRNIELCQKEERGRKLISSPNFHSFKEFDHELVAVERTKTSILMNRPIYVGFCILELSKLLMYEFHYNFIKTNYKDKATLLFTDTDSLCYHITTQDIYEDMKSKPDEFDFSDYPSDHPLFSNANKKKLGKFKDELHGEIAYEFVGLKAKMYSLKTKSSEKKRAKGVSTRIVRKKLIHEDYVTCLRQNYTSYEKQVRIAQTSHHLFTVEENKKCLSPFDDKRYILNDGISTYAYGHIKISEGN